MAVEALVRRIQTNPRDDDAWLTLFGFLADGPVPGPVVGLLTSRHQLRRDAAKFTYERVIGLVAAGKQAALERLYEANGPAGAFRGLFAYGLALLAAKKFNLDATVGFMREAAYVNSHCRQQLFAHETGFCTEILGQMLQQASLLEGASYAATTCTGPSVDLPDMAPDGLLVFAACCETYFQAYGERFVAQLAEAYPQAWYLIHILNPTAEGEVLRDQLLERFPRGGFSGENCPAEGAFYASRRFMVAPSVRARYHCDLVVMDVDSVFSPVFSEIIDKSSGADLSYFGNSDQLVPSLLVAGAYLYLPRNSDVADAFLASSAAYLERKLGEAVVPWTVDQAALFRALCLLDAERARTQDMTRVIQGGITAIVAETGHEVPEDVRKSRRAGRDILHVEFDQDRRPVLLV